MRVGQRAGFGVAFAHFGHLFHCKKDASAIALNSALEV
jgi:hypothetical protein